MIEEKLSKINETIPKVNNSNEEKYNIYNEVKNSEYNKYDKNHKFSFIKIKLIPIISCFILLLLVVLIINNYQDDNKNLTNDDDNQITNNGGDEITNNGGDETPNNGGDETNFNVDAFLTENQYCEKISYQEWMNEIEVNKSGQGWPIYYSTFEANYYDNGVYDVVYSNDPGYYLVIYVDTTKVKTINVKYENFGMGYNVKDYTELNGDVSLDYRTNQDSLLFVKCSDEFKIPSTLGDFYPVQIFYINEVLIKEELFSGSIINQSRYFSITKSYRRTDNEHLVLDEIPEKYIKSEEVLKGKNAIIISDDLETILNKNIIKLSSYFFNNQLFYNEYIVFDIEYLGLEFFMDCVNSFIDYDIDVKSNVSEKVRNILYNIRDNSGENSSEIKSSNFIYYYKSDERNNYYKDLSSYYYKYESLSYLSIEEYKTLFREFSKTINVDYNINRVINNNSPDVSGTEYLWNVISTYEQYIEAAIELNFYTETYSEEFFETNNIIISYDMQNFDVTRTESIINLKECGRSAGFNRYEKFLILEFDKNDLSFDDYINNL
ncbi:MAG: hypothetical protein IJB21_06450 [Bacilli bacterium]|nr:hypothetical protein [Bacilli bacterium]